MTDTTELFTQAVQHHQAGDLTKAEQLYRRVLAENPGDAAAASNLGVVLATRGNLVQAEKMYRQAIEIRPNFGDALLNLGNLLRRLKRIDEAAACYRTAVQTPSAQMHARRNLWQMLFETNRTEEVLADLAEYTRAYPTEAEPWHLIGLAHVRLGRIADAIPPLEHALRLDPSHALAHNTLGIIKETQGDPDTGGRYFEAAIRLDPRRPEAFNNLALLLVEQGRAPEAIELFRRSLAVAPQQPHVHSNYLLSLNYIPNVPPTTMLNEHRHWASLFADPAPPVGVLHRPRADGVLHIGYVSADLRHHPVAAYMGAVLPAHDRSAVRVTCYASVASPDAVTDRLRGMADNWRDISKLTDPEAAELILHEHVDVLVDLSGHSSWHRLGMFARRPAPVQVTHFGYPNTTGIRAINYRFSDPIADAPGAEAWYAERLVRLPDVAWCWRPPDDAPPVGPLPAESAGHITFGSLNNMAKLTEPVLALWIRVLAAAPESRLVILASKSKAAQDRVKQRFAQHGLADRVEIVPRMTPADYFAAYNRIDIGLDPFPYNGGVTTCDALWMGVPVISLAGPVYAGRQGLMIATALNQPHLAADTPKRYVETAQRLAENRDALRELRTQLRDRLAASPLVDAPRFVKNLEAAYRTMVKDWRG